MLLSANVNKAVVVGNIMEGPLAVTDQGIAPLPVAHVQCLPLNCSCIRPSTRGVIRFLVLVCTGMKNTPQIGLNAHD